MTLQEMLAEYNRQATSQQRIKLEELRKLFGNIDPRDWKADGHGIGSQHLGGNYNQSPPKWGSLAEMNAHLEAQRKAQAKRPARPVKNPEARKAEIEQELDIIRGRVPTPKGYTINPSRVKSLLIELRQLSK